MRVDADIDVDLKDRDALLELIDHIPASILKKNDIQKHNVGAYLQMTPVDPFTGLCSLDYKEAEERGYFKFDFLNLSLYAGVRNEQHLIELVNQEPIWDMLLDDQISSKLFHVGGHSDVLKVMKPESVEQLAMVLALIRPGKRHLIGRLWSVVESEIWKPSDDGEYIFKKSHAIGYALAIVVQMNLMVEETLNDKS